MTITATPCSDSLVLDFRKTTTIPQNSGNASNTCIGRRLRIKRTARGMSGQELAGQLGIDWDDLDAYEAGTRRIGANLLLRVATLLEVRPDYFFRGYLEEELERCLISSVQ